MTQTATDSIQKIIENPADTTSWILITITILINIYQLQQNKRIAKTVEKFKNELAKNQFKFTRHTELQIECLKKMYDQVVALHFGFTDLIKPPYKTHRSLKSNIISFQAIFNQMMTYSHRNKILITEDIINQVKILHNKFIRIEDFCRDEFDNLDQLEDYNNTDVPEYLYKSPKDETETIQLAIDRINNNADVKSFEDDINTLRKLIETYFKKLVD